MDSLIHFFEMLLLGGFFFLVFVFMKGYGQKVEIEEIGKLKYLAFPGERTDRDTKEFLGSLIRVRCTITEGNLRMEWTCKPGLREHGVKVIGYQKADQYDPPVFTTGDGDGVRVEHVDAGWKYSYKFIIKKEYTIIWGIDYEKEFEKLEFSLRIPTKEEQVEEMEQALKIKALEERLTATAKTKEKEALDPTEKIKTSIERKVEASEWLDRFEKESIEKIEASNGTRQEKDDQIARLRAFIAEERDRI